jgi:hypothetical protein
VGRCSQYSEQGIPELLEVVFQVANRSHFVGFAIVNPSKFLRRSDPNAPFNSCNL